MPEIVFLVLSNYLIKHKYWIKYIQANTIISFILILIGLLMLPLSTSHLYGILIGLFITWISILTYIFLSFVAFKKIKSPKSKIWISFGLFVSIRWGIFLLTFLMLLFFINKSSDEIILFFNPIDMLLLLFSYQALAYSFIFGQFL